MNTLKSSLSSVADRGFLRGEGANPAGWGGGRQHTILPNFPKNCLKLKEFGGGARPKIYYIDPPLIIASIILVD